MSREVGSRELIRQTLREEPDQVIDTREQM
jgi:hypothetical protein